MVHGLRNRCIELTYEQQQSQARTCITIHSHMLKNTHHACKSELWLRIIRRIRKTFDITSLTRYYDYYDLYEQEHTINRKNCQTFCFHRTPDRNLNGRFPKLSSIFLYHNWSGKLGNLLSSYQRWKLNIVAWRCGMITFRRCTRFKLCFVCTETVLNRPRFGGPTIFKCWHERSRNSVTNVVGRVMYRVGQKSDTLFNYVNIKRKHNAT